MASEDARIRAVFADLLKQDQARIFGYIHSLVRDLTDSEDLFQKVVLILWSKFSEYDAAKKFFPWACGVARLEAANFLRSRGRHKLYLSDDLNLLLIEAHEDQTPAELHDRREALARCVDKLRERDRELVLECYSEGSGVQQAAERHGRSSQSIHNSLRRIRRALMECVARPSDPGPLSVTPS
jgi:RNA polymerase sigma-70 factor, ECF subfamily